MAGGGHDKSSDHTVIEGEPTNESRLGLFGCRSAARRREAARPITIDDESINYYLLLGAFQFVLLRRAGTISLRESDETPPERFRSAPTINHGRFRFHNGARASAPSWARWSGGPFMDRSDDRVRRKVGISSRHTSEYPRMHPTNVKAEQKY